MAAGSPTTGCCSRPAPSPCGCRCRAWICRTCIRCARSPIAARSSRRRQRRDSAVVMGASFIGLEVAASLRARGIEVHVVAPDKRPMERVLGAQMGDFVRSLHEEHGVIFHLEDTATAIDATPGDAEERRHDRRRTWSSRASACGRGWRSREKAGLAIDRGVTVNEYLETSAPGCLRGGRHRPLARPAQRRGDPRRALGRRRAPGPDRRAQHARRPASGSTPCRSSGASTTTCRSTTSATPRRGTRSTIDGDIAKRDCVVRYQAQRPRARGRLDLSRRREPDGGSGDGAIACVATRHFVKPTKPLLGFRVSQPGPCGSPAHSARCSSVTWAPK